uniref:Uncharacterized protein n=1 Tax=Pseudonaja textilis TaxID=8673 RepID=A0A670YY56_PSETE
MLSTDVSPSNPLHSSVLPVGFVSSGSMAAFLSTQLQSWSMCLHPD